MNTVYIKYLISAALLGLALCAGYYPFYQRFKTQMVLSLPFAEAFSAGIFLGVGVLHLLPEAINGFSSQGVSSLYTVLLASVIFFIMFAFDWLSRNFSQQKLTQGITAIMVAILLSLHSIFEGAALGFSVHVSMILLLFLAIAAHKWAASFSLAIKLNQAQSLPFKTSLIAFLLFALMTPMGIFFGLQINQYAQNVTLMQPIFNALAGGTFIYLGSLHFLSHYGSIKKIKAGLKYLLFGIALMGVVSIWV
jgi:solute carrier family 39 (zinc transporter), member 1/2/3